MSSVTLAEARVADQATAGAAPGGAIVQLIASSSFGGPERQMLELARQLAPRRRTVFASFSEGGSRQDLLEKAAASGFEAVLLRHDAPRLNAAIAEIRELLSRVGAGVVCCHGYKPDLLGGAAARRQGAPAIAVSRGWTAETWRVRGYEILDRYALRWMDRVVCVSQEQARKVRRAGVPARKVEVIYNAIRPERFAQVDAADRLRLEAMFPRTPRWIIGSAGRLSPEKGLDVLIDAAAAVAARASDVGFVHFGQGRRREALERRIARRGLGDRFLLPGHCERLDRFMPHFDVFALPSYTEGLPNVVLEAYAAGAPVVATRAGGTPELVEDGESGRLVRPGNAPDLARALTEMLDSEARRRRFGAAGRRRVSRDFTFEAQAEQYERLLASLCSR
ncbi:MAG: glycosyltransferase [Planctomycetes bacterium]|nr:glycosyltransferase [Planctomycetota bacterium]